jgi:hypothetical protein
MNNLTETTTFTGKLTGLIRTLKFYPQEPTCKGEPRWCSVGGFSKGVDSSAFAGTSLEVVFLYEITHLLDGTYAVDFCDTTQSLGIAGSFEEATSIAQAHFEDTVGCFLVGGANG